MYVCLIAGVSIFLCSTAIKHNVRRLVVEIPPIVLRTSRSIYIVISPRTSLGLSRPNAAI
jgi:hypothetical protein